MLYKNVKSFVKFSCIDISYTKILKYKTNVQKIKVNITRNVNIKTLIDKIYIIISNINL